MKGLILFGDSIFFGTGASKRTKGCGKILKSIGKFPVLIKGRNRDSTREGLKRLDSDVVKREGFSHIVLLFGNNDCRFIEINHALVDFDEYRENLYTMIYRLESAGKSVLISNLQPIDSQGFYNTHPETKKFVTINETPYSWQKRYSNICEEVARDKKVILIDIRKKLETKKSEILASDGLHPNDLGHRIIADTILETLNKASR